MKTIFKIALLSLLLAAPTAVTVEAQARLCTNGNCKSDSGKKTKNVNISRSKSKSKSSSTGTSSSKNSTSVKPGRGIRRDRYNQRERVILNQKAPQIPAGTVGGTGSQIRQNAVAAKYKMESLIDESGRNSFIQRRALGQITSNRFVEVKIGKDSVSRKENYLYGFAGTFIYDLGGVTSRYFGDKVVLTSMWRSEAGQKKRGQARTSGYCASTHPLATTVDLGRNSNSKRVRLLLERIAPRLESVRSQYGAGWEGVVEILRESTCYHIMVFPDFNENTRSRVMRIMEEEAAKIAAPKGGGKKKHNKHR